MYVGGTGGGTQGMVQCVVEGGKKGVMVAGRRRVPGVYDAGIDVTSVGLKATAVLAVLDQSSRNERRQYAGRT